jgi:hypothetical protein
MTFWSTSIVAVALSVGCHDVLGDAPSVSRECDDAVRHPEWLWCDDFEEDRLDHYFEYDSANARFVRAPGVGVGGSFGMRARYSPGESHAGSLRVAFGRTPLPYFKPVDDGTQNFREIYWRAYIRHAPDWPGGGGAKFTRATILANHNWAQAMIAHLWSGGGGAETGDYLVLDPASGTTAAGDLVTTQYNDFDRLRWLGIIVGQTPLFDRTHVGRWYCVEARVRLNDPDRDNGIFEFWIDGVHQAGSNALNWIGHYRAFGLNAVFFENYWNDGPSISLERYWDNIVVSTSPIGCAK